MSVIASEITDNSTVCWTPCSSQIPANIKPHRTGPLCREWQWIPLTKGQRYGECLGVMTSSSTMILSKDKWTSFPSRRSACSGPVFYLWLSQRANTSYTQHFRQITETLHSDIDWKLALLIFLMFHFDSRCSSFIKIDFMQCTRVVSLFNVNMQSYQYKNSRPSYVDNGDPHD